LGEAVIKVSAEAAYKNLDHFKETEEERETGHEEGVIHTGAERGDKRDKRFDEPEESSRGNLA
jgi:hypothetical protein